MINGRYKLIHYRGYGEEIQPELFDLENDPEELENLSSFKRSIANEMLAEITSKLESVNAEIFWITIIDKDFFISAEKACQ